MFEILSVRKCEGGLPWHLPWKVLQCKYYNSVQTPRSQQLGHHTTHQRGRKIPNLAPKICSGLSIINITLHEILAKIHHISSRCGDKNVGRSLAWAWGESQGTRSMDHSAAVSSTIQLAEDQTWRALPGNLTLPHLAQERGQPSVDHQGINYPVCLLWTSSCFDCSNRNTSPYQLDPDMPLDLVLWLEMLKSLEISIPYSYS